MRMQGVPRRVLQTTIRLWGGVGRHGAVSGQVIMAIKATSRGHQEGLRAAQWARRAEETGWRGVHTSIRLWGGWDDWQHM
jgi:hypothetical protein